MARIAGVNIPQDKIVHIALTYIHGIGDHNSKLIFSYLKSFILNFGIKFDILYKTLWQK